LYKQHFQLHLLLESFVKLLRYLKQHAERSPDADLALVDKSEELKAIRDHLLSAYKEVNYQPQAINDDEEASTAEDLVSLDSGEVSAAETVEFEARNRRESEYHIYGLLCERKWTLAAVYYRRHHVRRWGVGTTYSGLDSGKDADDAEAVMKIYCQILAERGERKRDSLDSLR